MGKVLLCITGISGSGKTTLANKLVSTYPDRYKAVVSTTDRPPRHEEQDGVDYHFVQSVNRSKMVQVSECHRKLYGVTQEAIEQAASDRRVPVLVISMDGIQQLTRNLDGWKIAVIECRCSVPVAVRRLIARGESPDNIEDRVRDAMEWYEGAWHYFTYSLAQHNNSLGVYTLPTDEYISDHWLRITDAYVEHIARIG